MAYNRSDYRDKWRIERRAAAIRRKLGLDQLEPLDPVRLADVLPAYVFYPEDFGDGTLARQLRAIRWDGFAFCVDDGTLMIVLNSARPKTRQTATLMEELSHHLLGHKPCRIAVNPQTASSSARMTARRRARPTISAPRCCCRRSGSSATSPPSARRARSPPPTAAARTSSCTESSACASGSATNVTPPDPLVRVTQVTQEPRGERPHHVRAPRACALPPSASGRRQARRRPEPPPGCARLCRSPRRRLRFPPLPRRRPLPRLRAD